MKTSLCLTLLLLLCAAPLVQAQSLGIGWAGAGAGFRYWVPENPWGLQAGGLFFSDADAWGDGGQTDGGRRSSEYTSWGVNAMYRFSEPGTLPIIYLNGNVGGTFDHERSRNCFPEPEPRALQSNCEERDSTTEALGAMLLGGLEWVFFERFSLAVEVGLRVEQRTNSEIEGRSFGLGPGFGVAFLFYLF